MAVKSGTPGWAPWGWARDAHGSRGRMGPEATAAAGRAGPARRWTATPGPAPVTRAAVAREATAASSRPARRHHVVATSPSLPFVASPAGRGGGHRHRFPGLAAPTAAGPAGSPSAHEGHLGRHHGHELHV